MLKKYGEDPSTHPMLDSEAWLDISGSKKKRKIRCSSLDIGIHGSSSSEVTGSSFAKAPTKEDIKEAVNVAMSSFVETQLMPILEPILKLASLLQESLQHGMAEDK